jgi:hypothetical protein
MKRTGTTPVGPRGEGDRDCRLAEAQADASNAELQADAFAPQCVLLWFEGGLLRFLHIKD